MPYCRKCGAYIPEDWDKCPACGTLDMGGAQAAQQARQEYTQGRGRDDRDYGEEIRKSVEDYLEKKRRESKQWADDEHQRRQTASQTGQSSTAGTASGTDGNKILSALSYLSCLFILPFILKSDTPENKSVRFHAKQGGILFAFSCIADIVSKIIPIGWVAQLLRLYFIYKGVTNAMSGKDEPLPYIGKLL